MNRIKRYLPQNILRTIYNRLILPNINYSILVWGFRSSRISKLQKQAVVWYLVVNIMHILSRYLNLWTYQKLSICSKLKLSNSITDIHKTLPLYFNEMFTKTSDRHNHGTRQQAVQILFKYPTITDIGRKCIRHLLPEIINKTQSCIREKVSTPSFNGFSTYIKSRWLVTIRSIVT